MNKDIVLIEILEQLLEQDEDITARTVARLHPYFNHASSITRLEMQIGKLLFQNIKISRLYFVSNFRILRRNLKSIWLNNL